MTVTAILTADQTRAAERAVFDSGVPEYDLMESAGAAVADIVWRVGARRDTLVLCGPGNNGGDGYVIARLLRERGVSVRVAALADPRTASAQQARARWDGPVEDAMDADPASQLVDALFGTGLTRGLDGALADRLAFLAGTASRSYAVDLPSGVHTDTGECLSAVPRFGICVALGAYKPAHMLRPASGTFGQLFCADIGLPLDQANTHRLVPPVLEAPGPDAHKYSRGLVAVVRGAMPGAAGLAVTAAARGGAGYVRLVGDEGANPTVGILQATPETHGHLAVQLADRRIAAVLIGPGLGRDAAACGRLGVALKSGHPLVVDADAITLLDLSALPAGAILTPHEGEFVRLFGPLPGSKIDRAREAARRANGVMVYKGPDTVIAAPDGRAAVARSASSWLSTAGTGDVLAGICASRLAVTGDPFRAACEAVWLHSDAARRAGPAFAADDLASRVPAAIAARL